MSQQLFSNFSPAILQVDLPHRVASAQNVAMATPGERFATLRRRKGFGQSGLAAKINQVDVPKPNGEKKRKPKAG